MSAPGFSPAPPFLGQQPALLGLPVLLNPTPYAFDGFVPVTLQSHPACVVPQAIVAESFDLAGNLQHVTRTPLAPASAAPWTFDLPLVPRATSHQAAVRITLQCGDGSGGTRSITAQHVLAYELAYDAAVLGFFTRPATARCSLGGRDVRDPHRRRPAARPSATIPLFWEKSVDGGLGWQTIAPSTRPGACRATGIGRLHAHTMRGVAASDNGALIRARVCYAPPGQIERCVNSSSGRLTVAQAGVAPSITQQPRSMSTLVGQTANFTVGVAGTPPPTIRWQVLIDPAAGWVDVGSPTAQWPGATPTARR